MNQDWFDIELFSHASFEEMMKADELLRRCSDSMSSIKSKLTDEEAKIADSIPRYLDQMQEIEAKLDLGRLYELINMGYPWSIYNSHKERSEDFNFWKYQGAENLLPLSEDMKKQLKKDGWKALSKIKVDDQMIANAEAKSRTNPYIWGSRFDIEWFQKKYSEAASQAREFQSNLEKLKKDTTTAEKRLSDLLKSANEEFKGRIQIQRSIGNLQDDTSGEATTESKSERLGFHGFREYSQLTVITHGSEKRPVSGASELEEILLSSDIPGWYVILDGTREMVRFSRGSFNYANGDRMIIDEEMTQRESVEKLFREFLS